MLTWDDMQSISQELTSDSATATITTLNRYMNVGIKYILSELGRTSGERTQTASTVASQQFYTLPPDYLFLKSVTITQGGIPYPVQEEESQENWNILNATSTQTSDIPTRFFIKTGWGPSASEIGFWPSPSSANLTITIVYEATENDLSNNAYVTGTVSVTNNNATVTGSGTVFTSVMVGRFFKVTADGLWYKVASFTDGTHITLENNYQGSTAAGQGYTINEIANLPEELQILPCYFAAAQYYHIKKDQTEQQRYWKLFDDQLVLGQRRHGTKTRGSIVRGNKANSRWQAWAPLFFPTNVAS